jgi:hypothetical protein
MKKTKKKEDGVKNQKTKKKTLAIVLKKFRDGVIKDLLQLIRTYTSSV